MVKKEITQKLPDRNPRTERDIAMDFVVEAHKKFDRIIKASVLFGSQAKNTATPNSDIDIIFIVDDAVINWDIELVSWYREELGKLISSDTSGRELHITTIKLTTWWHDLLYGDPVVINIVRYGEALIDSGGFFNPIKSLLLQGKIRSTPEAVYVALQRAPSHLARSKASVLGSVEGVFWCFIDASHAALITAGKLPPSPEHVAELLDQEFVSKGLLKESYVDWVREIYTLHKSISHGQVSSLKGVDIDTWQSNAEKFLLEMTKLVDSLIQSNSTNTK